MEYFNNIMTKETCLYDPEALVRGAISDDARKESDNPKATETEILNLAVVSGKSPITVRKALNGHNKIVLENLAEIADAAGLALRITFVPKTV